MSFLLLESGDKLLLESGDKLLLEDGGGGSTFKAWFAVASRLAVVIIFLSA